MIEAAMIWNEPNNKSHWDPELDPDWAIFAETATAAAQAIQAANPAVKRVLGGISPIDPAFIQRLAGHGLIDELDVIAVHGFPLDWNLWNINEWPQRIAEIQAVVPNRACSEAMLRSAGFTIESRIEEEVYLCRRAERPYADYGPAAVYPSREGQQ